MKALDGVRILLVDDNEDSLELLELSLQLEGAEVRGARSVDEALAVAEEFTPDVLISDLTLQGDDGCDLLRGLRKLQRFEKLPGIAVTGHSGDATRAIAKEAGFAHYLVKPVDLPELTAEVVKLVKPA